MQIRQETQRDHAAVYEVVKTAFAAAEQADGTEQDLVNALRNSPAFVPQLSLVAEEEGEIVGHILFTEAKIGGETALALAPLAVLPARQNSGVGSALVAEGHRIAAALGYRVSVVLGHPGYYPRFGYRPASGFGIAFPGEVPDEAFLAADLTGEGITCSGVVAYAPEFGI